MEQLPPPPVGPDVELRDFQFMPLDVGRLRRSRAWLICKRRPELAFYMMNLWTASWHDVPAGSLEDDDDVLAELAMCPPKEWPRVKVDAMRGWVKCSDGRLYHTVVVEKVRESWRSKLQFAYDRECGRLRKASVRAGKKDFVAPTFEEWDKARPSSGQSTLSLGRPVTSAGHTGLVHETSHKCPAENALKGQVRDSKGTGKGHVLATHVSAGHPVDIGDESIPAGEDGAFERVKAAYPEFAGKQADWVLAERACLQRIEEGATWLELEGAALRFAAFVMAGGRSAPQYVDLPSKFFGNGLWREDWKPPPTKAEQRLTSNLDAAEEFMRRTEPTP